MNSPRSTRTPPVNANTVPAQRNWTSTKLSIIKPTSASEAPPIRAAMRSGVRAARCVYSQAREPQYTRTTPRPSHAGFRGSNMNRLLSPTQMSKPPSMTKISSFVVRKRLAGVGIAAPRN